MEKKAIDCMAQHIKTFHSQAVYEVMADFGEPCQACPYAGNCSYNWLSIMEPLLRKSAIRIRMDVLEHSNKPGSDGIHPGKDMDTHQQVDMNMHPSYNWKPLNQ